MYNFLLLIPTIPISLIKTYSFLSYVSLFGIVLGLIGTFMLITYCAGDLIDGTYVKEEVVVFDIKEVLSHIGIAIFVFQRNSVILNLQANAKNKERYPYLLYLAVFIVMIWYMCIAFVGYFDFRSKTEEFITSNLEPLGPFEITTNLMFCANALTSYPI